MTDVPTIDSSANAEGYDVEIFRTGTWNGKTFTESDLDAMERAFVEQKQAGHVPVKFGHTAPDTEPAQGWIESVRRVGDRLIARIVQLSQDAIAGIKSGAWRHVSVELLRNVAAEGGRQYSYMLDGLALLGSARPAVVGLQSLDQVVHTDDARRWVFTYTLGDDDATALRRENDELRARLHRQSIDALVEGDVRARVVLPAAREQFTRLFKLTDDASYARVQPGDWQAFRATQPRPPQHGPASHATGAAPRYAAAPDAELAARVRAYIRDNALHHFQLTGERLDFVRAAQLVVREIARDEPSLLRAYIDQPGVTD